MYSVGWRVEGLKTVRDIERRGFDRLELERDVQRRNHFPCNLYGIMPLNLCVIMPLNLCGIMALNLCGIMALNLCGIMPLVQISFSAHTPSMIGSHIFNRVVRFYSQAIRIHEQGRRCLEVGEDVSRS